MAVVEFRHDDHGCIVRNFQPPKRAGELKYWWKAARKAVPSMPEWQDSFAHEAHVDIETIIIQRRDFIANWVVTIARKKHMRS